jgi:hypothetical protein
MNIRECGCNLAGSVADDMAYEKILIVLNESLKIVFANKAIIDGGRG